MPKAIAGFFRTPNDGEKAVAALHQAGFSDSEIGFLTGGTRGYSNRDILMGNVKPPASANRLTAELDQYAMHRSGDADRYRK